MCELPIVTCMRCFVHPHPQFVQPGFHNLHQSEAFVRVSSSIAHRSTHQPTQSTSLCSLPDIYKATNHLRNVSPINCASDSCDGKPFYVIGMHFFAFQFGQHVFPSLSFVCARMCVCVSASMCSLGETPFWMDVCEHMNDIVELEMLCPMCDWQSWRAFRWFIVLLLFIESPDNQTPVDALFRFFRFVYVMHIELG